MVSAHDNPGHEQYVQQTQVAARILGVKFEVLSLSNPDHLKPPSATSDELAR
jgi:hypothetical protein